ncbi:type-F conjugative transfer system secretin TraK [Serratia sp. UGAL515B_01]|uniref:TraK domain-containing protein n=1 Tax=Serratia sp. UGAL515B_01 TaxID=2986763 RepID=UPI0029541AAD|nr:type-F conjugative transfer system secretin TraK [Serratia sp. UGAL515B_01]WON75523.1 type-F conjugative transfer system secretin TraK [Serratia sp. UGAL515B_01]
MKSNLLFMMLAALVTGSACAESVTLNPWGRITTIVSNSDPNSISVPDDRVVSIQATQGVLQSRSTTPDGAVIFTTLAEKPFTVFVQTESGFSFSVYATPRKQPGLSLVVNNRSIRGDERASQWESSQSTYSSMLTSLISQFINNKKPDGFVFTKNIDISLSPSVEQYFTVRPVSAWRGDQIRIVRLDLTNRASKNIELNERYFWSKGVMAVSYWPRIDYLSPGRTVSAVIVLREEGGRDEQ